MTPPAAEDVGAPPEVASRLERGLRCLRRLQHLRDAHPDPDQPTCTETTPPLTPDEPLGDVGRFKLQRELGRGGFGIVYLAYDSSLRREVALKVPHAAVLITSELRTRFRHEAQAAAALDHVNVVPVYEAGEAGAICYLVSAYCPGLNLADWLRQRTTPVPCTEAAQLVRTLAEAVAHAHSRGVLHRDLKPANILLTVGDAGEGVPGAGAHAGPWVPKITDFGLAKLTGTASGVTRSGAILGTPCYMAPEQAQGKNRQLGPAVDVYALGALLYELLTGRPPFEGEATHDTLLQVLLMEPVAPTRLRPNAPRNLETTCLKCLHKEPHRRYASAAALAEDLGQFLDGQPIQARPMGRIERTWRWCRRRPAVAALLALLAVVLLGSLAGLTALWLHAETQREEADRQRRVAEGHRQAAEQQRQEADQQRQLAENSYILAREALVDLVELRRDDRFHDAELEELRFRMVRVEVAFYEKFLAQRGTGRQFQIERARALFQLGWHIWGQGTAETAAEAIPHFKQATAMVETLLLDPASNPSEVVLLAQCRYSLARMAWDLADMTEARTKYESTIGLLEKVVPLPPAERRTAQYCLAQSYEGLGVVQRSSGKTQEAKTALRQALAVFEELAKTFAEEPAYRAGRARVLATLAHVYREEGRLAEALSWYEHAAKVIDALLRDYPKRFFYQETFGTILCGQGEIHLKQKRFQQALTALKQSVAVRELVVQKYPKVVVYWYHLGQSFELLAGLYASLDRLAESEKVYEQALESNAKLPQQESAPLIYALQTGGLNSNLGIVLRRQGKDEAAGACFDRAIRSLDRVLGRLPESRQAQMFLYNSLMARGLLRADAEAFAEAVKDLRRALEIKPHWDPEHRLLYGHILVRAGDHAQAVAQAEIVLQGKGMTPLMVIKAAGICGRAAEVAEQDRKVAERNADRAVELLRRVHASGFLQTPDNQALLRTHPDFKVLRSRADFQKLLER